MDSIISVAVGGLIGVLGSVAAQWLAHRFGQKSEHHKLLREKAEDLCNRIDITREWMTERRKKAFAGDPDLDFHPPFGMVEALIGLYFKEADSEWLKFGQKSAECVSALKSAGFVLAKAQKSAIEDVKNGGVRDQIAASYEDEHYRLNESTTLKFNEFVSASIQLSSKIAAILEQKTKR